MNNLLKHIFYAGVTSGMRFETQRKIILLNRLSITLFIIVFTLRTVVLTLGLQEFTFYALLPYIGMLGILSIPYFNKIGYYKFNAFVFCVVAPVAFLFFGVISQTANTIVNINHYYVPRIFILGTLVLPLILIDTRNKVLLYTAIAINIICILSFDTVVNYIGVSFNPNKVSFDYYEIFSRFMLLPAFLMIAGFLFLTNLNSKYESQIINLNTDLKAKNNDLKVYNNEITLQRDVISTKNIELEQNNEEIRSQRDLISTKNELLEKVNLKYELINQQLTDSIQYAKNIQGAVLGEQELPPNYFNESFIFFKPKLNVSGDFYFYKEYTINENRCLIVAAVDCTGHGVPGGFLSMLGITLINEILQNEKINNAADILNHLRNKIKRTLNQTGNIAEQKDGMEMALCIYYPETKELDYAGAKNPLCIVNGSGDLKIIRGDKQPIGIHIKEKEFTNHNLQLNEGEMVYIFSDGIQDQFGGYEGKKMKFSNLQSLMTSMWQEPCRVQKDHVANCLNNWIYYNNDIGSEQIDDIVFVGMKI